MRPWTPDHTGGEDDAALLLKHLLRRALAPYPGCIREAE